MRGSISKLQHGRGSQAENARNAAPVLDFSILFVPRTPSSDHSLSARQRTSRL